MNCMETFLISHPHRKNPAVLSPEEKRQAEEYFETLLDLPEGEREAFILKQCHGHPEMAQEVRLLLAHFSAAPPGFLDSPAGERSAEENIGPYELQEVLGEGGMGVVYRAQQLRPVVRTVALKILKLGMDSREILRRFEAERQTLAQLEHPNIARVYDAGTTPDGRPYFVMEYVHGQTITSYCDEKRLTPRQRIELFIMLCRGVQYAHQQGIIHRDLKPTNILVTEVDGGAIPKVIDFGVAKAVQTGLDGATLLTQMGQLIGTPEYMSPEQAESRQVDTRTDIYSLGAVLYELLVGVLPIDASSLRQAGAMAMMKLIRDHDPLRPSVRASTMAGSETTVAERRSVAPRALARTLRGELDWISLKALEKDPERRYASVAGFAADLQRHLADEPVIARPTSTWYTMSKFARRHRLGVGVALAMGVGVALLAVGSTYQAQRVVRERDRANEEAAVSVEVQEFLIDLFYESDPSEAKGREVTAREILDRGARKVGAMESVRVRAELTGALGAVYQNLALYDISDSLYFAAMDLWIESEGMDHPQTLLAIGAVAGIYNTLGRHAESDSLFGVEIEGWKRLDLADDWRSLDATSRLASNMVSQRRFAEAESLYVHAYEGWRQIDGEDNLDVLRIRGNLAFCYLRDDRAEESIPILNDVLIRLRRVAGDDSPRTLKMMTRLADCHRALGQFAEAKALLHESHETTKRVMGVEHPDYLSSLESLASLHFELDEYALAEIYFRECLATRKLVYGPEHKNTIVALHNMAAILSSLKRYPEAEQMARETLALRLQHQGEEHPYTQQTRHLLGLVLLEEGQLDGAVEQFRIAVDHGFASPIMLTDESTKTFAPLLGREDFDEILSVVRQRVAGK